jgi:hypothetical protein
MSDPRTRAGANPAEPAPKPASFEPLPAAAVNRAVSLAMLHLEDSLIASARLLAHCDELADAPRDQSLAAVRAATRLLRNRSDAAAALARVACGESRHRTIVEYADGAKPDERLNSKIFEDPPPPDRAARSNNRSNRNPNGKNHGRRNANGRAAE